MSTLADELLNDFEDIESDGEEDKEDGFLKDGSEVDGGKVNGMTMDLDEEDESGDEDEDEEAKAKAAGIKDLEDADNVDEAKATVEKMNLHAVEDVRSVAGLMKTLGPVLEKVSYYQNLPESRQTAGVGSIEDDPEYHLLTQSNTLSTSIDTEIILVHKFIRDHYSIRFPELESLISSPLEYAKAVAIIGNGPMDDVKALANKADNIIGQTLRSFLNGATVMIVTVEATTSRGREMTQKELETVMRACEMVLSLDKSKKILGDYVQSRMNIFAPNLTELIGSLTAAQLINAAGGVTGLAKVPACNVPQLGSKKRAQTGFATNVGIRQQGFLFHSPLVQRIPNDLKRQAMRIVSGKLVLAARVDRVHSSKDGSTGQQLKQDCLDRLDKLMEPPPNKGPRAVAPPDDKPSRKRGGRRARKAKEATAMTDLRRAQNRMAFGKEEQEAGYGTGEGTVGMGMVGQANDGRIRAIQVDQRTKAKLSKNNKGWGGATPIGGAASSLRGFGQGAAAGSASTLGAHGLRSSGIGDSAAGTSSTVAFTPVQGLELVDPKFQKELKRKREAEEDRWFKGGTFTQVGTSSMAPPAGGGASGSFKVPQLPAKANGNGSMAPPPKKSN